RTFEHAVLHALQSAGEAAREAPTPPVLADVVADHQTVHAVLRSPGRGAAWSRCSGWRIRVEGAIRSLGEATSHRSAQTARRPGRPVVGSTLCMVAMSNAVSGSTDPTRRSTSRGTKTCCPSGSVEARAKLRRTTFTFAISESRRSSSCRAKVKVVRRNFAL